ncbi:(4Fe-4S)-binding protein [Ferruginibacter lapsinanis]|uniref:(4Fe-4S)-binding protein n=1 Tax=Ferruginibacter lapsinanis TaxID=563172 RepID=UPI001E42E24B|nr:(4Fe-4S)-binding protein [Ferruginibacter lapsinanis]UEG51169.1 (4Fe-4S)-binding protein [Ferruginibacter lapsinanis]
MPIKTHKYTNGEITVLWQPDICIHSAICFKGLAEVFDPRRKPWIDMNQADTERIIDQVKKCPSGAISIIEKKN